MKENSKNNYRVYLSPVGGAKRSGFEGSVEKLDTERNLMTPRPLLMTLTSQLDVRANVGGLGSCAGVNPLTDLSRSYLICLSQRGVARGYTGESWRKGARTSPRTPSPSSLGRRSSSRRRFDTHVPFRNIITWLRGSCDKCAVKFLSD